MTISRFIQIHYLTAYPASLLNRDDAGFAKRMPFGGAVRTRISSQCLKRHWRTFQGRHALSEIVGESMSSVRSRYIFEQIAKPLYENYAQDRVNKIVKEVSDLVLGAKDQEDRSEGKKSTKKTKGKLRTNQLIVLGRPEIDYLTRLTGELLAEIPEEKIDGKLVKEKFGKDGLKNLKAIGRGAGLDAALFGRMKTSDVLADCDAAVHVAHAFTIHGEQTETDYFTAVDDLVRELDEQAGAGAAHVNTSELTSGLYYGYVAVDMPLLISNLAGTPQTDWEKADCALAGNVVERLVHLSATVSPGAKRGSTAPYSYAEFVAIEAGASQPCTWANAFFSPVRIGPDMAEHAVSELSDHVRRIDQVYEPGNARRYVCLNNKGLDPGSAIRCDALKDLARWASDSITGISS